MVDPLKDVKKITIRNRIGQLGLNNNKVRDDYHDKKNAFPILQQICKMIHQHRK